VAYQIDRKVVLKVSKRTIVSDEWKFMFKQLMTNKYEKDMERNKV